MRRIVLLGTLIFLFASCSFTNTQSQSGGSIDESIDASHESCFESLVSVDEAPSIDESFNDMSEVSDESISASEGSSDEESLHSGDGSFESVDESPELSIPDCSKAEESEPEVSLPILKDKELADLSLYVKGIFFDMRYATENNIAGKVIYDDATPYLRYGTVKKLLGVIDELKEYGYTLLVWDAYRKVEYQWTLWEAYPDPTYVADPNRFYSDHSRGDAIDVTLVTLDGKPVEMPTDHDDFTNKADRDYRDVNEKAAENAKLLEKIMKKHGFKGYESEWWHYSDTIQYSVIK